MKLQNESELDFWRRTLFEKLFYLLFLTGSAVVLPSAIGGFLYGVPFVGIFDIVVYLIIIYFYFKRSMPINYRYLVVDLLFVIGVAILLALGPVGAGFIWLFAYNAFGAILFGKEKANKKLKYISFFVLIAGLIIYFGWFPNLKIHEFGFMPFVLTALNILGLMYIINRSFSFIIARLESTFLLQKKSALRFHKKTIELEKTNKDLDSLVYSISHDIRSPLANIKGLATLGINDAKDPTIIDYFNKIENSSDKLNGFTEQITQFFKAEKALLKPVPTNLFNFISNIYENNFLSASQELTSLENNISKDLHVNIDNTRLSLVFMNLFSNSIKYQASSRPLKIEIDAKKIENKVILIFTDNGQGIEESLLPDIFEIFTRATKKSKGAGLGLYIVRSCVEALNGQIEVSSKKDSFTRFTLTLPLN